MPTLNVPTGPNPYPTIQAAIDAASSGDIIAVLPGLYQEIINVYKPGLTFTGAQANVDARTRGNVAESIITYPAGTTGQPPGTGVVNIFTPEIIINGFTIRSVENNLTDPKMPGTAAIATGNIGIYPPESTNNVIGLRIINNKIINNANGILLSSTEPATEQVNYQIGNNYFQNNNETLEFPYSGHTIYVGNASIPQTNVLVEQNLFDSANGQINVVSESAITLHNTRSSTINFNLLNRGSTIAVINSSQFVTVSNNILLIQYPLKGDF